MPPDRRQALLALASLACTGWPAAAEPGAGTEAGSAPPAPAGPQQGNLWAAYAQAVAAQLGLGVADGAFKVASGLAIADWEAINITGMQTATTPGTKLWQHAYAWGDAMPAYASPCYLPGSSFYDMYAALLAALDTAGPDQPAINTARARLALDRVSDDSVTRTGAVNININVNGNNDVSRDGSEWPAYRITPGLNDFMLASLQSMISQPRSPQFKFTMYLPDAPQGCHFCSGITRTRSAQVDFQAQTVQMFRVQPGRWYDAAMARGYGDRIATGSALTGKPLFGPEGLLNVRTSQILVAMERSVTIHLNPDDLQRCAAAAAAMASPHATLRIGGFCFDPAQTDICSGAGALTFRDNTSAPYVVGVTVDRL